jgi:hypothetical protein
MDEGVHQRAGATGRCRTQHREGSRPRAIRGSRNPERYLIEGEATPFTLHTVLDAGTGRR